MNITAPARRRTARRTGVLAVTAIAVFAVVAGCSDEQRRDLGGEDIRISLTERVEQVVADQGLELDGDLTCSADISDESVVTASCEGTTTSGAAVVGTFDGTADIDADAGTCTADLVVLVDGASVADEPAVDCFAAG